MPPENRRTTHLWRNRYLFRAILLVSLLCSVFGTGAALAQHTPRPSTPPEQQAKYAPDRDYDLQHVALDLNVDYARHAFQGVVVNTLTPLRDGLTTIVFQCGKNLSVEACEIAGRKARFIHEGKTLKITNGQLLARGEAIPVTVRYSDTGKSRLNGFYWIQPTPQNPQRIGFWTHGQYENNHEWVPTWDYPNDFATSEIRVTVPGDWYVVGNGFLESNNLNADTTRTFHWRLKEPHATYLISLCAGPFDMKVADWRGVKLMYVVPKGKGPLIDDNFGTTPEMLSFFSDLIGVKYPWPKYALCAVSQRGGALENLSATLFPEGILRDKRMGLRSSEAMVAHELAHQWFGDLVTPKVSGHDWLNEGFATFFQALYFEHSRGKDAYDQEIEGFMQNYFRESRQFKHALGRRVAAPSSIHPYHKGASVLHTLRRTLGDKNFFQGLQHYLTKYRHTPVVSHDLCDAMTEGTGINLEPFFDQWVYKPGHPMLDYVWTWDKAKGQVVLTVRQTQDTKDGTPIFDLNATIGLITSGRIAREKAKINKSDQEIRIDAMERPDAVLLDPDHDFLREIPTLHWDAQELPHLLKHAPNAADRVTAMNKMLEGTPSDASVRAVTEAVAADKGQFPTFRSITPLTNLKRAELRPVFRQQLTHPHMQRRAEAIRALRSFPKDDADIKTLRALVNDQEAYAVVKEIVAVLQDWDAARNRDVFEKALQILPPEQYPLRLWAHTGLKKADSEEKRQLPDPDPKTTEMMKNFLSDLAKGNKESSLMTVGFLPTVVPGISKIVARELKELKSFTFTGRDDLNAGGFVRFGELVSRICYYEMLTGKETHHYAFLLTTDSKVVDYDSYKDTPP